MCSYHYTPNGEPTTDQTRLGFVFADAPLSRVIETDAAFDTEFEIPPGAANCAVTGSYAFEKDMVVTSFFPHMHLRATAFRYELLLVGLKRTATLQFARLWHLTWGDHPTLLDDLE